MRTSSRQSLTRSAHNAGEECRNSNVTGDAAETGLQNGNGRIRSPEASKPNDATLAGRYGELRYSGIRPYCKSPWQRADNFTGKNLNQPSIRVGEYLDVSDRVVEHVR